MIPRIPPSGPVVELLSSPPVTFHDDSGATAIIDWSKGNNQAIELTTGAAPCVVTSNGLPPDETASLTLQVQQDGTGSRTIVFVDGQTPGGSPLALSAGANATDLLDLFWTGHVLLVTIRGKNFS